MPLSEFYRSANEKQKPTDTSYVANDEFMELVWEKGQVMMQGQSSKAKKTPVSGNFQLHTSKMEEKEALLGEAAVEIDDDDMVPWLLDDYCSDLLPQVSCVTPNEPSSSSRTGHLISCSYDQDQIPNQPIVQNQASLGRIEQMVQKQDSPVMNFSHFSRPVAMARANLHNSGFLQPGSGSCGSDMVKKNNVVKEDPQAEKSVEPIAACSSVCSGNSAERASNEITKDLKRKSRDTDGFESQSEDIEEESLGTKAAATSQGGTSSKRSRAAEVHNLSERRRRDRINEKMRALQELIPNCNKVDKASMLDEAIEYLKTLQLQVQIMSMGSGLCMPSMVFPSGIQQMYPHFSAMGIGMGSQGLPMLFPQPPMPGFPVLPPNSMDALQTVNKKDQFPQTRR